jgi:hypothetical protein
MAASDKCPHQNNQLRYLSSYQRLKGKYQSLGFLGKVFFCNQQSNTPPNRGLSKGKKMKHGTNKGLKTMPDFLMQYLRN